MAKIEINYKSIPPDLEPKKSIVLWRYMSFSSLCEILMNNHIPLISIGNFSDKTEGVILQKILSKLPNINKNILEFVMDTYRKTIHVSSWHTSDHENAAMWDRYTYGGEGVAIKTNAELLIECIKAIEGNMIWSNLLFSDTKINQLSPNSTLVPHLMIKPIVYEDKNPTDFEMEEKYLQNGYDKLCFFYKLKDFKDEAEVRILKTTFSNPYSLLSLNLSDLYRNYDKLPITSEGSVPLKINSANKLIQKIIVSPYAHHNFIETVKQTIGHTINPDIVFESRRKNWVF